MGMITPCAMHTKCGWALYMTTCRVALMKFQLETQKPPFSFSKATLLYQKQVRGVLDFCFFFLFSTDTLCLYVCVISVVSIWGRESQPFLTFSKVILIFLYDEWNDIFYIFVFYLYLWHLTIKSVFHQGWDLLMFISLMYLTCLELLVL